MTESPATQAAIDAVRADVARLHAELVRYGLVVWTGGNVSGRVPGSDYFVIKPSGVSYDDLTPANMILCHLDGTVVEGTPGSERSPSSDTAAHAYVYREMPEVGGVVHTHSPYAVAWAARLYVYGALPAGESALTDSPVSVIFEDEEVNPRYFL